jgi:hypothetical protein
VPANVQHRTLSPGVGWDEQMQRMSQMAHEIRFPIPGSLQPGCSKRSYQRFLDQGLPFGGSRGGRRTMASILQSLIFSVRTCGGERVRTVDM